MKLFFGAVVCAVLITILMVFGFYDLLAWIIAGATAILPILQLVKTIIEARKGIVETEKIKREISCLPDKQVDFGYVMEARFPRSLEEFLAQKKIDIILDADRDRVEWTLS